MSLKDLADAMREGEKNFPQTTDNYLTRTVDGNLCGCALGVGALQAVSSDERLQMEFLGTFPKDGSSYWDEDYGIVADIAKQLLHVDLEQVIPYPDGFDGLGGKQAPSEVWDVVSTLHIGGWSPSQIADYLESLDVVG